AGRKGDYTAVTSYEKNFIAGTPGRIEAARTQVAWSAINALAAHLGSLGDRRKTLVIVADGLARSDGRRGQESLPTLETVVRSANKSNVAIYTVDPRDPAVGEREASAERTADDPLHGLPGETDGRAISGNLDAGLAR